MCFGIVQIPNKQISLKISDIKSEVTQGHRELVVSQWSLAELIQVLLLSNPVLKQLAYVLYTVAMNHPFSRENSLIFIFSEAL